MCEGNFSFAKLLVTVQYLRFFPYVWRPLKILRTAFIVLLLKILKIFHPSKTTLLCLKAILVLLNYLNLYNIYVFFVMYSDR